MSIKVQLLWRHVGKITNLYLITCSSAGLGEFRIRDLNDEINKLLREKRHWEDRIKELGGPDYGVSQKDISVHTCLAGFSKTLP